VLKALDAPSGVEIIGIVVNARGAERAIATGAVQTLGFPYSISPQFLKRNQHQTPEESLDALEAVGELAYKAGLDVTAYISMAFGNPYGDAWSVDEVADACELLIDTGVRQISLADTVGLAAPARIGETVAACLPMAMRSRLACIFMRGRLRPRRRYARLMRPGADASTRPSVGWGDAPSRRMRWWEIFPLRF